MIRVYSLVSNYFYFGYHSVLVVCGMEREFIGTFLEGGRIFKRKSSDEIISGFLEGVAKRGRIGKIKD